MLPSKGFFNTIPCPYYESGNCTRYHCHYKHNKKDKKSLEKEEEKEVNRTHFPAVNSDPILKISVELEEKHHINSETRTNSDKRTEKAHVLSKVPTDLKPPVPSYKPTPIAELKKRHIPVCYAPSRATSIVIKKKTAPEGKKCKTEYIPEVVNDSSSNYNPLSYNPTPAGFVKSFDRPEYSPEINSDIQTLPHSYTPSKIGEESTVPTTIYIPEGGSETSLDYIPGSSKPAELPCYVPQTSTTSTVFANYTPTVSIDKGEHVKENHLKNHGNNKSISNFDNLNFAEINDEINLLQEILEEDGFDSEKDCVEETTECSDAKKKLTADDDEIKGQNKECNGIKNIINKVRSPKSNSRLKHFSDKQRANKTDCNSTDNNKSNQSATTTSKSEKKLKFCSTSDTISKMNEPRTSKSKKKSKKSSREKSKSDKHKSNHKSHSKSNAHSSSESDSNTTKYSQKSKGDDVDEGKSRKSKHKKSSKGKDSKQDTSKKYSEKNKSKSGSKYKKNKDKTEGRQPSDNNSDDNSPKEGTDNSDDDVEIVQEALPSIVISDSDSEYEEPELETASCASGKENISSGYLGKRRIAHETSQTLPPKKLKPIHRNIVNTQTDLIGRWHKVRSRRNRVEPSTTWDNSFEDTVSVQRKVRIAHVPNVDKLLDAKNKLMKPSSSAVMSVEATASCSSASSKTYVSPTVNIECPLIGLNSKSKIPAHIRQNCLRSLFDVFLSGFSPNIAAEKALTEEQTISERITTIKVYKNLIALAVMNTRRELMALSQLGSVKIGQAEENPNYPTYTYGWSLYKCILQYKLDDDQLRKNGYPKEHPRYQDCAFIPVEGRRINDTLNTCDPELFNCVMCKKLFRVNKAGFSLGESDCEYHLGKMFPKFMKSGNQMQYSCCNGDESSFPCGSGQYHVRELANDDCLEGFVSTLPPRADIAEDNYGVYSIDCEMCYTTFGCELARVTVVNVRNEVVYDKYVVPFNPIVDYCTRFSGITKENLENCKTRLSDVQKDFLKMFNSNTILIGHSLNNDLKVLKIIHNTVVDTSVLFPHKRDGYKKALRSLTESYLQRTIQNHESGHDSAEDAIACMDLVLLKVKEDSKSRKPRNILSCDRKNALKRTSVKHNRRI